MILPSTPSPLSVLTSMPFLSPLCFLLAGYACMLYISTVIHDVFKLVTLIHLYHTVSSLHSQYNACLHWLQDNFFLLVVP